MDIEVAKVFAAAICMGIGSIAPAIGEGWIASSALQSMARNPDIADKMFTNMLVAMAVTETMGIFALVISLVILFAV